MPCLQPRLVHLPMMTATAAIVGRSVSKVYDEYEPDLVVSVHPLMQHVPVRVLKQRIRSGVQKVINFATVVTDLTTCHNTWFYPGVDRCYVATETSWQQARWMGLKVKRLWIVRDKQQHLRPQGVHSRGSPYLCVHM